MQHEVAGEGLQQHAGHADRQALLREGVLETTGAVWLKAVCDRKLYVVMHGKDARESTP